MGDLGGKIIELLLAGLGWLVFITDSLTAIGFAVTFAVLLIGGAWWLGGELLVRFRSLAATDRE